MSASHAAPTGGRVTPSQMTLAIEAALRECEKRGFLTLLRPSLTIDAACYLRDQFGGQLQGGAS